MCMSKFDYSINMKVLASVSIMAVALGMASSSYAQEAGAAPPSLEMPAQPQADEAGPAVTPPPTAAIAPPATPTLAPPGAAAPAPADPGLPPTIPGLDTILDEQGIAQDVGGALPPGMDLPLDQALPNAELSKEEKELQLRKKAFDAAVNGVFPLRPDEIRKMLELRDETNQAVVTPIYPNPIPESVFETISLDPGTKPLVVKTAIGNVTTISMVDASGQPWPIKDMSWAGEFEIQQPDSGTHMIRITPSKSFAQGNVSMTLVGLNPPIILSLRDDREHVHVRMDIQVPEIGPNGVAPLINTSLTGAAAGNAGLASILEGVAPAKAKKLTINGVDGRTSAYDVGGVMYLRTPYTLLSPAWNSSARSADGTNVYALASTPVLILSDKGKMVRAFLSGEEKTDGQ